ENGDARVTDALDQFPRLPARPRVERGGQLVETGDLGLADQREGDEEPLLLPSGELSEPLLQEFLEPELLCDGPPVGGTGVQSTVELQRLPHGQLGLQLALLELDAQDAGHLAVVALRIEPRDPDGTAVGQAQPFDALDRRGLARTVGAEDSEYLTFLDGEVDVPQDGLRSVGLV